MVDSEVGVVLLLHGSNAAGRDSDQFSYILGKPLFVHTLDGYLSLSCVKKVCLSSLNLDRLKAVLSEVISASMMKRVCTVKGDQSRNLSIKSALIELQKYHDNLKLVVVDDGDNCGICPSLIRELLTTCESVGCSGTTSPSLPLVKATESFLDSCPPIGQYYHLHLPQAFAIDLLLTAFSKLGGDEGCCSDVVDCLQLVLEQTGVKAKLIPAPDDFWKVHPNNDPNIAASTFRERRSNVCVMSEDSSDVVTLLCDALRGRVATVEHVLTSAKPQPDSVSKLYNTVVLFHLNDIVQDQHLLDFASLLDLEKQGVIIHVIDHATVEGLQSLSVYNLHRNNRKMAHNYEKLHKGVALIHCVSSAADSQKVIDIILTIIQADPFTFSGQTFFL